MGSKEDSEVGGSEADPHELNRVARCRDEATRAMANAKRARHGVDCKSAGCAYRAHDNTQLAIQKNFEGYCCGQCLLSRGQRHGRLCQHRGGSEPQQCGRKRVRGVVCFGEGKRRRVGKVVENVNAEAAPDVPEREQEQEVQWAKEERKEEVAELEQQSAAGHQLSTWMAVPEQEQRQYCEPWQQEEKVERMDAECKDARQQQQSRQEERWDEAWSARPAEKNHDESPQEQQCHWSWSSGRAEKNDDDWPQQETPPDRQGSCWPADKEDSTQHNWTWGKLQWYDRESCQQEDLYCK